MLEPVATSKPVSFTNKAQTQSLNNLLSQFRQLILIKSCQVCFIIESSLIFKYNNCYQIANPYANLLKNIEVNGEQFRFYDLTQLNDPRYGMFLLYPSIFTKLNHNYFVDELPFSIRVLLESAVRSCDGFHISKADIEKILDWKVQQFNKVEVPFRPSRVLLQDLTGVAAVVDFAGLLIHFNFGLFILQFMFTIISYARCI